MAVMKQKEWARGVAGIVQIVCMVQVYSVQYEEKRRDWDCEWKLLAGSYLALH